MVCKSIAVGSGEAPKEPWSGHYFIYIISCRMCLAHRAHDCVAHLQRINNKINRFTTAGHCIVLHKRLPTPCHPKDSMDSMGDWVAGGLVVGCLGTRCSSCKKEERKQGLLAGPMKAKETIRLESNRIETERNETNRCT